MVSRDTPSQCVPSFDHRVTQCRSAVMFSVGSSRNDFQFHRRKTFVPSSTVNSHFSSAIFGVGPAERTGKSVVRYCPGGSFTSATVRLPKKPREMVPIRTSPMRERANWLKSQSLIGKTKSFASQTSHHHSCSAHAGCHEPDGDPGRVVLSRLQTPLCCSECQVRARPKEEQNSPYCL